jgi:hypothetical protein
LTPLIARLRFFGKFVVAAAVIFFLWKAGGAGAYAYAVLVPVTVLSPMLTGYRVSIGSGVHGVTAFFEAGATRVEVPFILHEALAGVIPFIALMCASSGQTLRQWAERTVIGLAVIYAAHVAVLIVSPLLVTPHERWVNRIIDVTYGFYAVAGFVGLPFSLWIIFTRPWQQAAPAEDPAASAAPTAGSKRGTFTPRRRK